MLSRCKYKDSQKIGANPTVVEDMGIPSVYAGSPGAKSTVIYLSSSCLKSKTISSAVRALAKSGFLNVELSGGAGFNVVQAKELLTLKKGFDLNYLCHNSFACSSREHFAVNLASLNDKIYLNSLDYLKKAIGIAKKIGASKFGIHAGFFIDLEAKDLGTVVPLRPLADKKSALFRFCDGFNILKSTCGSELELYIENNVYSFEDQRIYGKNIPFMLTQYTDYEELRKVLDFKLLLDIAHLKVSCNSLGLSFNSQLGEMINLTDYLHLSQASKTKDQHRCVSLDSSMFEYLKKYKFTDKTITLEIHDGIEQAQRSYLAVKTCLPGVI